MTEVKTPFTKRLSRTEKRDKAINDFKEKLDEQKNDISEEEYNQKLHQFISEARAKYKKTRKGKIRRLEEFRYDIYDKLKTENPKISNDDIVEMAQPMIDKKKLELSNIKKNKPGNKTRTQKLDRRRKEYIKHIKEDNPNITEEELAERLEDYKKVESSILEDDIIFNKRVAEAKKILEKEFGTNQESLNKIKNMLIKKMCDEKEEFLKGSISNDTNNNKEVEKKRILAMKESGKTDELVKAIDKAADIFLESSHVPEPKHNMILKTDSDDILLQKYKDEIGERYTNKLLLKERYKIINIELTQKSMGIRKDIQIDRKLINERESLYKELSTLKKYKNNKSLLDVDLDNRIKKRRCILEEYRDMGIDPDHHDKISLDLADKIWIDVNDNIKKNPSEWNQLNEKQKLDPFIDKYNEFATSYPIILKYMVFQRQYSSIAFKKFLEKCRRNLPGQMAKHKEILDVRFQNQAFYIKQLYIENKKKMGHHINYKIADKVFNETLSNLRKEKSEFEERYKEIKKKINLEDIDNGKLLISELVTKVKSGYVLDNEEESDAIKLLEAMLKIQKQSQDVIDSAVSDSIIGSESINITKL